MIPRKRRQRIIERVTEYNGQSVTTLADALDVSKATIRRDLNTLETEGRLKRTHGGAVPLTGVNHEQEFRQRVVHRLEEKQAIAERAVEEIRDTEVVLFDSGTTTIQVARATSVDTPFTAITNSPPLALELGQRSGQVILTGGTYRQRTMSLVGPAAESYINSSNFDLLFLATNGIDVADGAITSANDEESHVKELMISQSGRVVLVASTQKFGERHFSQFGTLDDVDLLITDGRLTTAQRRACDRAGVSVVDGLYGDE